MNSAAYLTKHGWLGNGHSLHPKGHGIKKPLLIAVKQDLLGVGKKKNDVHADQWWARMFESTLKELQIGTQGTLAKPEALPVASSRIIADTLTYQRSNKLGIGDLYAHFVKGESLDGTLKEGAENKTRVDKHPKSQRKGDEKKVIKPRKKHKVKHRKL